MGQVREAYGELLSQVADSCYEDQLFSFPQAFNRLAKFLAQEFSDQADQPSRRNQAIYSFRVDGKWYALFFPLKGGKLGLDGEKAELNMMWLTSRLIRRKWISS
ncbi:MAG: hypothetical protein ACLUP5_02935 [Streptococcus sp.]